MMNIALLSPDTARLETLATALQRGAATRQITRHPDSLAQLGTIVEQTQPDVLVAQGWVGDGETLQAIERLMARRPQLIVILLTEAVSSERLLQAMRAGVREVLADDTAPELLEAAMTRAEATLSLRRHGTPAQMVAFMPGKGGSGATFLASNTGFLLGQDGQKVLLLDLSLQFGEAALTVQDRQASSDIVQVAQNLSRLDAAFLEASTLRVTPKFSILAAPDNPAQLQAVAPDALNAILDLAVNHYDLILMDLPLSLDALTIRALDRADTIFLVVQAMLPHLRNASRLMAIFNGLGYPAGKVELLVNRYQKNDAIGLDQLRASLGSARLHTIPNGYAEVARAVNQGVALAQLAPTSPVCKALVQLSDALQHKVPARSTGLLGWLSERVMPATKTRLGSAP